MRQPPHVAAAAYLNVMRGKHNSFILYRCNLGRICFTIDVVLFYSTSGFVAVYKGFLTPPFRVHAGSVMGHVIYFGNNREVN